MSGDEYKMPDDALEYLWTTAATLGVDPGTAMYVSIRGFSTVLQAPPGVVITHVYSGEMQNMLVLPPGTTAKSLKLRMQATTLLTSGILCALGGPLFDAALHHDWFRLTGTVFAVIAAVTIWYRELSLFWVRQPKRQRVPGKKPQNAKPGEDHQR